MSTPTDLEAALRQRLHLEEKLAACCRALLADGDEALTEALVHLRDAAGVSRVYVFAAFQDPDAGTCVRQTHEVCAPGVKPEIDNPDLQHFPLARGFERWERELRADRPIAGLVAQFPESERSVLAAQDILSILVIPLWVEDRWYGFIGFDDTSTPRRWREEDVRLLRTAAEMIGIYLGRQEALAALRQSHAHLGGAAAEPAGRRHPAGDGLAALSTTVQHLSSELRRAQDALRQSESRFRSLFENSRAGIAVLDGSGILQEVNPACCRLLSQPPQALLGTPLAAWIHEADRATWLQAHERSRRRGNEGYQLEVRLQHPAGSPSWVLFSLGWICAGTVQDHTAVAMFQDISQEKHAQGRRLAEARQQKELLVREVHHRIKNHLQGIVNLLRGHTRNGAADPVLEAAIQQVEAIAVVHGLQGRDLHAGAALREILEAICHNHQRLHARLTLQDRLPPECHYFLRQDDAVSVALVLNELIHNACKHGHGGHEVHIRLRPQSRDGDEPPAVMDVEAGVLVEIRNRPLAPLPPGFDLGARRGLGTGLELVLSLLPEEGSELALFPEDDRICARLRLRPPVLLVSRPVS